MNLWPEFSENGDDMSNEWLKSAWSDGGGNLTWRDETLAWLENNPASFTPPIASEVRITFSRPFTWSERESFRRFINHLNSHEKPTTHRFGNPSVVFIESGYDSREIVGLVSEFVSQEYLNIHPRAVRTIFPETVV